MTDQTSRAADTAATAVAAAILAGTNAAPDYMAQPTYSLAERSVLCRLATRMWRAEITDKKLARETAAAHGSDQAMHTSKRKLLATEHLAKLSAAYTAIKAYWYANSLPWTDDGTRVVRSTMFLEVRATLDKLIDEWHTRLVPEFLQEYPYLREDVRARMGDLFDPNEYPDPNKLSERFVMAVSWRRMPTYTDWRAEGVPADILSNMAASAEAELEADMLRRQRAELVTRLRKVVQHMADRLPKYQGGREGSFHDTVVTNISDLLDTISNISVVHDPDMDAFVTMVRDTLCHYHPDTLRSDQTIRENTAAQARAVDKVLDQFS